MAPPFIPFLRFVIAFLTIGFNVAIKLYFKSLQDDRDLMELRHRQLESELRYLKYQINPHFFMNTLNNIHALVDIDSGQAKVAIIELSKLMRYVLYESGNNDILLSAEIQFLKNYVGLMRLRYNPDLLRVTLMLLKSCQDTFEAMRLMSEGGVDLIFIDINMPDLNGLEFIRSLPDPPLVIFTTAYPEYAVDGFKLNAVDYLLKPFEFQDLLRSAEKARKRFEYDSLKRSGEPRRESDVIFVKSEHKIIGINVEDIKYIEGMSEYARIYVQGEEKPVITFVRLQKLEGRLPDYFKRVHKSYIVNLRKVLEVSRQRIIFDKKTYIPIGDSYKEEFMKYISTKSIFP